MTKQANITPVEQVSSPGLRPAVRIVNQDAHREYMRRARAGGLEFNEARNLQAQAYELMTNNQGFVQLWKPDGLTANSLLRKDEWEELDREVTEAVHQNLNIVQDLRDAGLVRVLGGPGTMVSQFNVASEKVIATTSMTGDTVERDRVEKRLRSWPVPVIHSEYKIGWRELDASRRAGDALDTTEAMESGVAVAEKLESMTVDGDSNIVVGGAGIDGLTSITGRDTDTATNYGGGDFGTALNGPKTVLGMISALAAKNYYGPFGVYVANTQYWQLLTPLANRSGSDLQSILDIPQVQFCKPNQTLAAGEVVLVQLTRNVIDVAIALDIMNREWRSGDELSFYGKVMGVMVVRIKLDFAGNIGVAHATGA